MLKGKIMKNEEKSIRRLIFEAVCGIIMASVIGYVWWFSNLNIFLSLGVILIVVLLFIAILTYLDKKRFVWQLNKEKIK